MASAAAERYFQSFPAGQQEVIRSSWGGADLMDEWFKNAVAAGAVGPDGSRPEEQGANAPNASSGGFSAADLRNLAKSQGWSEDFARYNDQVLQGWINNYWDPKAQRFVSSRGAQGYYDKPTECPPGMSPSGPNENSPCQSNDSLLAAQQPAQQQQAPAPQASIAVPDTLQTALEQQFITRGGLFNDTQGAGTADIYGKSLGGGGLWWGADKNMFDNSPFMTATKSSATSPLLSGSTATTSPALAGTPAGGALEQALLKAYQPQMNVNNWWQL